ncbi:MAG: tetratricopeptide repeat protein, partial [Gammaproteobacteria bacterium]
MPALAFFSFLVLRFDWLLATYDYRTFDLGERLMTEARVIWFYLALILLPRLSALGLYHDDIAISRGLLDPPSTLWAILGLFALLAIALRVRRKAPMLSFGILFFLAGHSMESTVFSLEIAHEHRNYVPMIGILLALFYYLLHPGLASKFILLRRSAACVFLILMASLTALRANAWGDPLHHVVLDAAYHPRSSRVNYEAGRLYFEAIRNTKDSAQNEQFYKKAEQHFTRAYQNDEYHSGALIALLWLDSILGKPNNEQWLAILQERLEQVPMAPHNVMALKNLNQCQVEGDCPLPDGLLNSLLESALSNT